ncbi:TniQ family protein [Pseudomonas aeruginosa]|uniref:TniQ family protein n=1 Tax=Pseudomonas aeruginosa TaxID=287 RepID=UPI00141A4380|nr:TniQ family protein [Pseudomonas aeruginosa]MBI8452283.1 TniQ family protein [Pseudomonas aeruginosa]HEJ2566228.1 TniQ family protein [Pseudomonas aeruginosa]HEJ2657458.1 TniQ family protein [Pseudomonas aeruginosa]
MTSGKLDFFPTPFPDETLYSVVTRYNLLTATTSADTYKALYDGVMMGLSSIAPKNLSTLAERIPGSSKVNRFELLKNNTLLPVFAPFQEALIENRTGHDHLLNPEYPLQWIMPQGLGFVRTCLPCAQDDYSVHGVSYWHRSHQIPGVICCWKHGTILFDTCPACNLPLYHGPYKLRALAKGCTCGWSPQDNGSSEAAPHGAKLYAHFTKALLNENLPPTGGKIIENMYISKMKSIGLRSKKNIPDSALIKEIKNSLGEDFIRSSYPSRRMSERKYFYKGSSSPINVQLTIALLLYGSVENFKQALLSASGTHLYRTLLRNNTSEKQASDQINYRSQNEEPLACNISPDLSVLGME